MNREELPKTGDIFAGLAYAGVWQDKGTQPRQYVASGQPQSAGGEVLQRDTTPETPALERPKHHGSQKRRVKELSGCVSPETFDHVERMREQWAKDRGETKRLSRSEVVGTLVTRGVQGHIDMQYGTLLEPIIKKTIREQMQGDTNRAIYIAVQSYYSAEESRIINTKVLSYLFGSDTEIYKQVVAQARKEARVNIRRTIEEK